MTTAPLVLGLPGDLVDQTENIDHTATKAGGLPFLPARCDAAALPELKCGVCGKLLSLVFQVRGHARRTAQLSVIYVPAR